MRQNVTILGCWLLSMSAALLMLGLPETGYAEGVLERINRTGVFNAGTRSDVMPFAYRSKQGELIGFSVDLLGEIHKRLEKRLGRPLELRLQVVTPSNRIDLVKSGTIDIECGITTPTWVRDDSVDFSIPFFGNGTRVMALRTTATRLEDLGGRRIGAVVGSTTVDILARSLPDAVIVEVPSMDAGLGMLDRGEIDGLSNVGIVLRAGVEGSPLKSKVLLLPRIGSLSYEAMACMLPQNESSWRDLVNKVLAELLEGIDDYRGAYMSLYERWFGPRGVVYFPLDQAVARRLAASLIWLN